MWLVSPTSNQILNYDFDKNTVTDLNVNKIASKLFFNVYSPSAKTVAKNKLLTCGMSNNQMSALYYNGSSWTAMPFGAQAKKCCINNDEASSDASTSNGQNAWFFLQDKKCNRDIELNYAMG